MWIYLIIILVIIVGKFLFDSNKQTNKIKAQGGIRTKYAHLIQCILASEPRLKVIEETATFINIGISGAAGSQQFLLQQTFGKLTVHIVVKNNPLLGNLTIERIFPENMSQDEMMQELANAQQTEINKRLGIH